MLALFLQSLAFGALLVAAAALARRLLRRMGAGRPQALPAGQALRCVRPLRPGAH